MTGRHLSRLLVVVALGLCLPMPAAAQDVVEYYGTDAIGSVRIVFDVNGNVVGRMDYGPFGEQQSASATGHKSYAGLFRDGEAGLDYAEARSYQGRTGRFNAPDSVYAGLFNPQRWNLYSYAVNNPLLFVDTTGLDIDRPDGFCQEFPEFCDGNLPPSTPGPSGCGPAPSVRGDCGEPPQNPPTPPPTPPIPPIPPPSPPPSPPPPPPAPPAPAPKCEARGWIRIVPDYINFSVNVAIPNPLTLTAVGVTVTASLDRFGNVYAGGGANVGKAATLVSGSFTGGWLFSKPNTVSSADTTGFLRGWSYNGGGGFLSGSGVTVNRSGTAGEVGAYWPQIGASATRSGRIGNILGPLTTCK
jgi:RHS repeat-associated protein